MKKLKKGRVLGRTKEQRKALLNGLASSLFINKRITTTISKAKELKPFAEKLITKAKDKSPHKIRIINKSLPKKSAKELFDVIGPKCKTRKGGYLRIFKLIRRNSDSTRMALIELVDFDSVNKTKQKKEGKGKLIKKDVKGAKESKKNSGKSKKIKKENEKAKEDRSEKKEAKKANNK